MANRSLNKVQIIGNLTRDPELRYTPQGTAVCNFGVATNRTWVNESGEKNEDVEFHRVVAWAKLAEICAQFLFTGRRVYIEGRLQTREWQTKDGTKRQTTEIVANEMIILDSRTKDEGSEPVSEEKAKAPPEEFDKEKEKSEDEKPEKEEKSSGEENQAQSKGSNKQDGSDEEEEKKENNQKAEVTEDDIPF